MSKVVQRFDLQKAFVDENTVDKLARAGYRGQGPLTTFMFLRFVTPFAMFFIGLVLPAVHGVLGTTRSGRTPSTRCSSAFSAPTSPTSCSRTGPSSASSRSAAPGPIRSI